MQRAESSAKRSGPGQRLGLGNDQPKQTMTWNENMLSREEIKLLIGQDTGPMVQFVVQEVPEDEMSEAGGCREERAH